MSVPNLAALPMEGKWSKPSLEAPLLPPTGTEKGPKRWLDTCLLRIREKDEHVGQCWCWAACKFPELRQMKKCPEQLQMTMKKDNTVSAHSHYSMGLLAASRPPGRGWTAVMP